MGLYKWELLILNLEWVLLTVKWRIYIFISLNLKRKNFSKLLIEIHIICSSFLCKSSLSFTVFISNLYIQNSPLFLKLIRVQSKVDVLSKNIFILRNYPVHHFSPQGLLQDYFLQHQSYLVAIYLLHMIQLFTNTGYWGKFQKYQRYKNIYIADHYNFIKKKLWRKWAGIWSY